jgi:hypothetical protein
MIQLSDQSSCATSRWKCFRCKSHAPLLIQMLFAHESFWTSLLNVGVPSAARGISQSLAICSTDKRACLSDTTGGNVPYIGVTPSSSFAVAGSRVAPRNGDRVWATVLHLGPSAGCCLRDIDTLHCRLRTVWRTLGLRNAAQGQDEQNDVRSEFHGFSLGCRCMQESAVCGGRL